MAILKPSPSDVFTRFFHPVLDAYAHSKRRYLCHEITDCDFLELGVLRAISDSKTGRDFLQRHGDHGRKQVEVDLFFKALKSGRRLENTISINERIAAAMRQSCPDPLADIAELENYAVYAGDGHFHAAAVHDHKFFSGKGEKKKYPVGHFFVLNLRTHHLAHLTVGEQSSRRVKEHDMHAIKRQETDALRQGAPKGTKVIMVWDKAGIDFGYWQKVKRSAGLYFISREKENMDLQRMGNISFDRNDSRNDGVVADEFVGPGSSGGAMLRRVTYLDPVQGNRYVYITTEMNLPPGIIALLYKHRWDIEKVFDELKNKLYEKKAWASSAIAKTQQAQFLCLAHNLLTLLEEMLRKDEGIKNEPERRRKQRRLEKAIKRGGNYVATTLQRFTVRCLKFIRWVRNFVYQEAAWEHAVTRLRQIYAVF